MKLHKLKEVLNAEILCGENLLEKEVAYAYGSDLMSDVLAYVKTRTVLLTGLINSQVIRTAEMAELSAIIFVRGKRPDAEIIALAIEHDIVLLATRDSLYTASGKLFSSGLQGIEAEPLVFT